MDLDKDVLGRVIKEARNNKNLTVEEVAEKVNVTPRHIGAIENENKKPSYEVLYSLIRLLDISPDLIFYPERPTKDNEIENLVRLLYNCDEHTKKLVNETVKATVKAIIDNLP